MRKLNALAGEGASAPFIPQIVESGTVSNTPASIGEDVYVVLDDLHDQPIGPVLGWRTAPESSRPQRGNRCAIARASDGRHWFISWEPS